jgi:dolichyl-phosphate beta-glucosyltransferase
LNRSEPDVHGDPTTKGAIALSYVVPAYNSAATIDKTLDVLGRRLEGAGAEIVVVENGSRDDTPAILQRIQRHWPYENVSLVLLRSDKGLGVAYRTGIAASRGARVVLTADDLPFGFDDLDASADVDPEKHPVVIGSKGHRDSQVDRGRLRQVLTRGFWLLRRVILGMRTLDPQGTFILAGDWARRVTGQLTEPGYLVTTELCYLAERNGHRPVEVPVRLAPSHTEHGSRITVQDVWQMGVGLVGIRRRHGRTTLLG